MVRGSSRAWVDKHKINNNNNKSTSPSLFLCLRELFHSPNAAAEGQLPEPCDGPGGSGGTTAPGLDTPDGTHPPAEGHHWARRNVGLHK